MSVGLSTCFHLKIAGGQILMKSDADIMPLATIQKPVLLHTRSVHEEE
jgi:hypothetical protein